MAIHAGDIIIDGAQPSEMRGGRRYENLIERFITDDMYGCLSCRKSVDGLFEGLGGLVECGEGASAEAVIISVFGKNACLVASAECIYGDAKSKDDINFFH
jgi:hypothetical protein